MESIRARERLSDFVEPFERPQSDFHGGLPQFPVGSMWASREECSAAGVHRPTRAGIAPGAYGAYSICASGRHGDVDHGIKLTYSGTGGQSGSFGASSGSQQNKDQWIDHEHNESLAASIKSALPVRVVRGHNSTSIYAPAEGYRYDGLYKVLSWEYTTGQNGRQICSFELERLPGQPDIPVRY